LPISVVITRAMSSWSWSRRPAARFSSRARSANVVVRYVRNVASASWRRRSVSSAPMASYVFSVSPFAGFTVAVGMTDLPGS
jgi:hypothetical protein